jgi:hypothetical protein
MLPLFARHTTLTDIPPFTLMQWFGNAIALNRMLHTLALMTACGLWVAILGFRIRRSQPSATVARLLIVWGGLCIVIGNTAAYRHEFVWMFLTPGLAVSTALLIESASSQMYFAEKKAFKRPRFSAFCSIISNFFSLSRVLNI